MTTSQQVLDYIVQHKQANDGNSPTIREMMAHFDLPSGGIIYHLDRLQAKQLIERAKGGRGIRVVGGRWLGPGQVEAL